MRYIDSEFLSELIGCENNQEQLISYMSKKEQELLESNEDRKKLILDLTRKHGCSIEQAIVRANTQGEDNDNND